MLVDILIIIFAFSSLYRGYEIGLVRQLCSTIGFFGGLFLGAWLQHYTIGLAHSNGSRSLVTALTTLGCAIILLTVGEYVGVRLKHVVKYRHGFKHLNIFDDWFGSIVGVLSLLISTWLIAAALTSLPISSIQIPIQQSRIVRALNKILPDAPTVIANLGRLVDPNGFPQVFVGGEPVPRNNVNLPDLGDLQAAVNKDKASIVKIVGQGCGGIVEGSGFVVGQGLVATNAHVVAGIRQPFVQDGNGNRATTAVWFDPNLDFAVLRVKSLAGKSLPLSKAHINAGSPAAVVGYPGGGGFSATPAAVLDQFKASGRNIYNEKGTDRDVFELRATVIPGNSGGPLIARDGSVIGVVFAESTAYQHVGYALTMPQVLHELKQVTAHSQPVSTGSCAD